MTSINNKEKYTNLINELKYIRNFKKKLTDLYLVEFEDKFENILNKRESEFMNIYSKRMKLIIEDMFSDECYECDELISLMKNCEKEIYDNYYKTNYKILTQGIK